MAMCPGADEWINGTGCASGKCNHSAKQQVMEKFFFVHCETLPSIYKILYQCFLYPVISSKSQSSFGHFRKVVGFLSLCLLTFSTKYGLRHLGHFLGTGLSFDVKLHLG
jgi:hypothetical protein